MDKQKQEIIEISLALKNAFMKPIKKCLYPEDENCIGKDCERFISGVPCRFLVIAEHLHELGVRKNPRNSKNTVLTNNDIAELLSIVARDTRKETAEKFAERVKMAFYYEFDELIPSIMADKIDKICKEITEGKE